ncbi:MAG: response regulator transcription factor [Thermoleophilia bacterium]|nr:response regulator transcription factor [Thermoleophilia bacterium]
MTIRVLLADDQELVRAGLRTVLESEDDLRVIGEAANGREAVDRARELHPHVVAMDIRMPVMDGIEATRRLQAIPEPPRVLILTTFDLDELVAAAIGAGASGFLLKDAGRHELAHAIRVVHAGEALLAPTVTRRLLERFADRLAPPARPAGLSDLTGRETEVLELVARGLSNTEIAAQLVVSETTVKTHVGRVFAKLGLRDRAQAVVLAYESGLIRPGS